MKTAELCDRLERYVALRRALGFQMTAEERLLRGFVSFVECQRDGGAIQAKMAMDWACSTACGPGGKSRRLSVARRFLEHLRASVPDTGVPSGHLLERGVRRTPHIYSDTEIGNLLKEARQLRPRDGLRPHTIATLIGLLASSGIRVGEALRLRAEDVDLGVEPPRLKVLLTKFRKSRLVPLHASTAVALSDYADRRRSLGYEDLCDHFFVSDKGEPLTYQIAGRCFRTLARRLGIRGPKGERGPTLHDLRHTLAVRRLIAWYREGEDVHALIPKLSVYLGHAKPQETYWYLTATPRLLKFAALRFEEHAGAEEVS